MTNTIDEQGIKEILRVLRVDELISDNGERKPTRELYNVPEQCWSCGCTDNNHEMHCKRF